MDIVGVGDCESCVDCVLSGVLTLIVIDRVALVNVVSFLTLVSVSLSALEEALEVLSSLAL